MKIDPQDLTPLDVGDTVTVYVPPDDENEDELMFVARVAHHELDDGAYLNWGEYLAGTIRMGWDEYRAGLNTTDGSTPFLVVHIASAETLWLVPPDA